MPYIKLRAGNKPFTFSGMVFVPNKILQVTDTQIIALQNELGEEFKKLFALFTETSLFSQAESKETERQRIMNQLSNPFTGRNNRGYQSFELCLNHLCEQYQDQLKDEDFRLELLEQCRKKSAGINIRVIKEFIKSWRI